MPNQFKNHWRAISILVVLGSVVLLAGSWSLPEDGPQENGRAEGLTTRADDGKAARNTAGDCFHLFRETRHHRPFSTYKNEKP